MQKLSSHQRVQFRVSDQTTGLVIATCQATVKVASIGLACLALSATSLAESLGAPPESFRTQEFNANWGLGVTGAEYAYSMGFTGAGVKLGIADGAFQLTHPEFDARIFFPSVFPSFPLPGVPLPEHGTHVMGVAAAARNGVGMMGVAFDAQVAGVVAVEDEDGYPPPSDWAGELITAGVSVMNGSFGPDAFPVPYFEDGTPNPNYIETGFQVLTVESVAEDLSAVERLSQADVVMVFAAGNERGIQPTAARFPSGAGMIPLIDPDTTRALQPGCDIYASGLYCFVADNEPEGDPNDPYSWEFEPVSEVDTIDGSPYAGTLIATVAVDRNNDIAYFSNFCGAAADWCLAAPGVDIYSTVPMSTYAGGPTWSGTSMASPFVAGAAAVVRQAFPYMTARQVIEVLLTTATDLGDSAVYGHGLLNLGRAVKGPIEFGHPSLIAGNASIFAPVFAVDTQGHDSVWSNDISGVGGFSKAGAGVLTLRGSNTYTGDTTVTGGVLRVDGTIANSDLTVKSGGTLQGIGTVGDTLMAGVLSPGNSVGTLTVDGDLLLANGSTYLFEIDAAQNADLLVVVDEARIESGAIFELSAEDGVYLDRLYPMIQASTLTGTFENQHTDYTFLDLDFITSGGDLNMVVERNPVPMANFAQTNNQQAVANAIDGQTSGDEPYNDVLLNETPSQLAGWYQDWSGEIYSANQAALVYNSRLLAQVVNWRLQDSWLDSSQTARLQQVGQPNFGQTNSGHTKADTTVWAQGYGNWDSFSANDDAQKATANSGGFIMGVDHALSPSFRLGGGFSASVTETSVAASRANTMGYHALLYGTYHQNMIRLNGGVVQSWSVATVNRTLPLDDQGNASGTVASRSTQVFADLSTPIKIQPNTTLSPFGQLSQIWLHTSNFGETGAEAGLNGQAATASTGFGTLGARLSHQWQTGETHWQASVSAGWQRAWGDRSPTTTLAFATGPDFTVSAAPIAKDSAVIEVGIGASLGPSSRLNLVYSATLAGQSNSQMLQAQLQWWF